MSFREVFEDTYDNLMSMTDQERAEARAGFESQYPELSTYVKAQKANDEPTERSVVEAFNPHPDDFLFYVMDLGLEEMTQAPHAARA